MRFFSRFKKKGSLIFVSHDANAIIDLCDKAILLEKGGVVSEGKPKDVIEEYTNRVREEIKKKEDKVGDNEYNYVEKRVVGCDERERWSDYRTEAINKTDIKNIIKLSTIGCEYAELEDVKSSRAILLTISMKNEKSKDKLGYIVGGDSELDKATRINKKYYLRIPAKK